MKHSCGHKAPSDMPKQAVRSVPRCNDCQARRELQDTLDERMRMLARMFPYTAPSSLWLAVRHNARNQQQQIARADMFIAGHFDCDELLPYLSQREVDEYVKHGMTGD